MESAQDWRYKKYMESAKAAEITSSIWRVHQEAGMTGSMESACRKCVQRPQFSWKTCIILISMTNFFSKMADGGHLGF